MIVGSGGTIVNGTYAVTPQCATALRLDDEDAKTTTGNPIDVYTANGTGAQNGALSDTGVTPAGYYNLSTEGAYCLTASGTTSGSIAVLDPCAGTRAQAWEAVASGSNYVFHPASNTALCLDVAGASSTSGTAVQVYTCNSTNAQAWALTVS
ncbi:MAG: ricin-type beta-trefoil lectin domain protein [Terracidiphilus sp.]